ncbi:MULTISPECIES: hypothetical protein [Acetivibrio]|jgi:hypothetical protein|uniref:Uncharacterized protein n=2 Tax=Acetivibrio TaxID=35829 RepID=W4VCE8_9FIRM|nr:MULTISPECIES: hypothetical protein [Acetivibrio]RXE60382.1 hypothetical protein EFD62_00115 [Acetivibrio mesophilus]GAE90877.1 hypothetical protein JCM21531_4529 [Acetivibrio straminisolvens JCM 21531]
MDVRAYDKLMAMTPDGREFKRILINKNVGAFEKWIEKVKNLSIPEITNNRKFGTLVSFLYALLLE